MKVHDLKIRSEYLTRLIEGQKTYEVRLNDRDYQVGDILKFKDPDCVFGVNENDYRFRVIYMTHLFPFTQTNHVVLGVEPFLEEFKK